MRPEDLTDEERNIVNGHVEHITKILHEPSRGDLIRTWNQCVQNWHPRVLHSVAKHFTDEGWDVRIVPGEDHTRKTDYPNFVKDIKSHTSLYVKDPLVQDPSSK